MFKAKITKTVGDADFILKITIGKREFVFNIYKDAPLPTIHVGSKFPTQHVVFNQLMRNYIPWIDDRSEVKKNMKISIMEQDDTDLIFPDFLSCADFNTYINFLNNYSEI